MKTRKLNGYNLIYCPNHPSAMKSENWNGFIYEHVYIYEKEYNIIVPKGFHIHHIDLDKSNNDISNLIMLSVGDHSKLHSHMNRAFKDESLKMNWVNSGKPKVVTFKKDGVFDKEAFAKYVKNINKARYASNRSNSALNLEDVNLVLERLVINNFNIIKTSREFEISDNGLRKRLNRYGITKAILSQAKDLSLEGATTTGEVMDFLITRSAPSA